MFITQHVGAVRVKKGNEALMDVKQNDRSLRDYTTKFTNTMNPPKCILLDHDPRL